MDTDKKMTTETLIFPRCLLLLAVQVLEHNTKELIPHSRFNVRYQYEMKEF